MIWMRAKVMTEKRRKRKRKKIRRTRKRTKKVEKPRMRPLRRGKRWHDIVFFLLGFLMLLSFSYAP